MNTENPMNSETTETATTETATTEKPRQSRPRRVFDGEDGQVRKSTWAEVRLTDSEQERVKRMLLHKYKGLGLRDYYLPLAMDLLYNAMMNELEDWENSNPELATKPAKKERVFREKREKGEGSGAGEGAGTGRKVGRPKKERSSIRNGAKISGNEEEVPDMEGEGEGLDALLDDYSENSGNDNNSNESILEIDLEGDLNAEPSEREESDDSDELDKLNELDEPSKAKVKSGKRTIVAVATD